MIFYSILIIIINQQVISFSRSKILFLHSQQSITSYDIHNTSDFKIKTKQYVESCEQSKPDNKNSRKNHCL